MLVGGYLLSRIKGTCGLSPGSPAPPQSHGAPLRSPAAPCVAGTPGLPAFGPLRAPQTYMSHGVFCWELVPVCGVEGKSKGNPNHFGDSPQKDTPILVSASQNGILSGFQRATKATAPCSVLFEPRPQSFKFRARFLWTPKPTIDFCGQESWPVPLWPRFRTAQGGKLLGMVPMTQGT